jgi:hypothetical protein
VAATTAQGICRKWADSSAHANAKRYGSSLMVDAKYVGLNYQPTGMPITSFRMTKVD